MITVAEENKTNNIFAYQSCRTKTGLHGGIKRQAIYLTLWLMETEGSMPHLQGFSNIPLTLYLYANNVFGYENWLHEIKNQNSLFIIIFSFVKYL